MDLLFIWLIASGALVLFELSFPGYFFCISVAFGCLFGALSAGLGYDFLVQGLVVAIVSLIQFSAMRRVLGYAKKIGHATNIDALIGKKAVVVQAITPTEAGLVKIDGEVWSAAAPMVCAIGGVVTVTSVAGNRVLVSIQKEEESTCCK